MIPPLHVLMHDIAYPTASWPAMSVETPPGLIIAVTSKSGGPAQGKSTLLRLLARQILPTDGFIVYPTRWRVRLCDRPEVFDNTLGYSVTNTFLMRPMA